MRPDAEQKIIRKEIRIPKSEVNKETSERMGKIRQRGTAPELIVRKFLNQLGLRYRTANRDLPGSPDMANRSRKWAVFVHGCFWHRHQDCRLASTPKTRTEFWLGKFAANVDRDRRSIAMLTERGYEVVVIWQCELKDAASVIKRLANLPMAKL